MLSPRGVGFRNVKQLIRRMSANRETERHELISVDDLDVPPWQRQIVWNDDEMGLLAHSIINNYPIGMLILWQKDDGVRVPIDGRQRLTAIRAFYEGRIAIPALPGVRPELRNAKFLLQEGDEARGYHELSLQHRETFEDYELSMVQYENIVEDVAMDIFVMLQGGKSLTKTEVRAALGGQLSDFVTDLTTPAPVPIDENEEEEATSRHPFFRALASNVPNRRKAHRNVCDILIHEFLYPDQDKHWQSLEGMYREKARHLSVTTKDNFRRLLNKFHRATLISVAGERVILPQMRSTYLILTFFKAWAEIEKRYDMPNGYSFAEVAAEFETLRASHPEDLPWVNFSAALSNAGYAKKRIETRHDILMSFILQKHPTATPKNRDRRSFTMAQKIAIWERAGRRCEWNESGLRCPKEFPNPREADADHIVMWKNNGPTTVKNGRLLCPAHNRGRRE